MLAEKRERLGLRPDEVWERLVQELTARRAEMGLDQRDVVRSLLEEEGDDADPRARATRISNWETMARQPRIDEFAAWARAVGMRLVVNLEPVESQRRAVMVEPDRADLAASLNRLDPRKLADAERIVEWMFRATPGEIRRTAEFLKASDPTDD